MRESREKRKKCTICGDLLWSSIGMTIGYFVDLVLVGF